MVEENEDRGRDDLISLNTSLNLKLQTYDSNFNELHRELNIDSKYINEFSFIDEIKVGNLIIASINIQSLPSKFTSLKTFLDQIYKKKKSIDVLLLQETYYFSPDHFQIEGFQLFENRREGKSKRKVRREEGERDIHQIVERGEGEVENIDRRDEDQIQNGRERLDGQGGRGGGTAIYINNKFVNKQIVKKEVFFQNNFECTVVLSEIPKFGKLIFASCYHPPSQVRIPQNEHNIQFLENLSNVLSKLSEYDIPIILGGDFNVNLLNSNEFSTQFSQIMASYGFMPYINRASRIQGNSFSLLDNIFMNNHFEKVQNSGVLVDCLSDHFTPFIQINLKVKRPERPQVKKVRNMCKENKEFFKQSLADRGWYDVLNVNDPNVACKNFVDTFLNIFDICFPFKTVRPNKRIQPKNPFITKGILISRKKKFKLALKAKKSSNPANILLYRQYRNVYNKVVRAAKKLHFNREIENAGTNTKLIWQTLKKAINITVKKSDIGHLRHNGILIEDDRIKANIFNEFFANVGKDAIKDLPPPQKDFRDYLGSSTVLNSIVINPITPEALIGVIKSLKPKDSKDINGISSCLLQLVASEISVPMSHIFNLSIKEGIFPDCLKVSKTVPIFKNGDHLDVNNYRGVSLIDSFSKVFEKALATRIISFLDQNSFFYKNQFGFRQGFSTSFAITKVTDFITNALNKNERVLAIFLDIKKAFDSCDREILLTKLYNAGIRGVANNLFRSYFQGRKQKVSVNGTFSEFTTNITLGVLQGSILGVLMFLIYINDIQASCTELTNILFADDNTGLIKDEKMDDLIKKSNNQLNDLYIWYNSNKLALHPSKSRAMLFYPPSRPPRPNELTKVDEHYYLPLYINYNQGIDNEQKSIENIKMIRLIPNNDESSFKLLGVLIDCHLNMKDHCKALESKISRATFAINQMKNFLDPPYLKLLSNAYIGSHLEYCCSLLSMCNKTTLKPLELALKKIVRLVSGVSRREHSAPLFKELNILPVKKMIELSIMKFMHKFYYSALPGTFENTWKKSGDVSQRVTRNAGNIYIPHFDLEYFRQKPLFAFPRVWNELPREIREIEDIHLFVTKARKHLMNHIE